MVTDTVLCRVSGRPDRGRLNVGNSRVSNTRLWDLSRTVPISRQGSACSANIAAITCCVVQLIKIGATMTVHSRPLLTTIGYPKLILTVRCLMVRTVNHAYGSPAPIISRTQQCRNGVRDTRVVSWASA